MRKVAFYTLGCKVNQSDSASMAEIFQNNNYEVVSFDEAADVYVINTCVVTNTAQKKSRRIINRVAKKKNDAIIVVSGCYPQTDDEEVRNIEGIDLIIGNQDRARVCELVDRLREKDSKQTDLLDEAYKWGKETEFENMHVGSTTDKTRAFLKIQEGCNQYCSYCIIPYARGPLRSRSLTSIKGEVERLVKVGFKEIVLLGIHLGAYGREDGSKCNLTDAVKTVLEIDGFARVRLGSLESIEVDDELVNMIGSNPRLCKHLHLPLQSGSDKILKSMHRPYNAKKYLELAKKIKKISPNIAITTDIIVGFPGETDEDFINTVELAKKVGFSKIHVFPFSPRKGTPAEKFDGIVPENVKKARVDKLTNLSNELHKEFCNSLVGTIQEVLLEQKASNGFMEGLSGNYVRVYVDINEKEANKIYKVKINKTFEDGVFGEIL